MTGESAAEMRDALKARLMEEGEFDLVNKLEKCGKPMGIRCRDCGHRHLMESRCKNKWCPACQRLLAAVRSERIAFAVRKFKWPLFITLTMGNVSDLDADPVRHLRRSFTRLRNTRLFRERIKGGVASIEVTNIGNGWHPHLHAVVDCRWLSVQCSAPHHLDPPELKQRKIEIATAELQKCWQRALKQEEPPIFKVKRCDAEVVKEVIKYSVKGSDLLESPDPIGGMIRCIMASRLMSAWGTCYRLQKQIDEAEAAEGGEDHFSCGECGASDWIPMAALAVTLARVERRGKD
jgi:hypothetical protein